MPVVDRGRAFFHGAQVMCLLVSSDITRVGLIFENVFLVGFVGLKCKEGFLFIN